jgi:hypothetical protein
VAVVNAQRSATCCPPVIHPSRTPAENTQPFLVVLQIQLASGIHILEDLP